jgi:hypothetical protein
MGNPAGDENMTDILAKLDNDAVMALGGMLVGVVAILGGITVAITKVMAVYYRKTQLDEMEATLKMEMIQRGMSADEIKQVLEARMGSSRARSLGEFLGGLRPARGGCGAAKQYTKG